MIGGWLLELDVVEVYGISGRVGCVLHIRDVHNGVFFLCSIRGFVFVNCLGCLLVT